MKELRFEAEDGLWRVAFAFDPERTAMPLVAEVAPLLQAFHPQG